MKANHQSPAVALKNAVSSLRTVGTVFILVGLVVYFIAVAGAGIRSQGLQIAASASLFLLAPGIVYHRSAIFIRRHDVKMALLARRTAILQSIAGAVAVVCLAASRSRPGPLFLYGAMPILFFSPALLVQSYEIGKALHALRTMPQAQHGFEVLAVLPIEEEIAADKDQLPTAETKSSLEDR